STTVTTTANITPKVVAAVVGVNNKIYNGTTAATINSHTLPSAIGGDSVTLTGGTAVFSDKNVGSNKTVTVCGLSLSGADAGNCLLQSSIVTTTANITPATLTVRANNLTWFMGSPKPSLVNQYTITGFVTGDSLSLVSGSATLISSAPNTWQVGRYT